MRDKHLEKQQRIDDELEVRSDSHSNESRTGSALTDDNFLQHYCTSSSRAGDVAEQ